METFKVDSTNVEGVKAWDLECSISVEEVLVRFWKGRGILILIFWSDLESFFERRGLFSKTQV